MDSQAKHGVNQDKEKLRQEYVNMCIDIHVNTNMKNTSKKKKSNKKTLKNQHKSNAK